MLLALDAVLLALLRVQHCSAGLVQHDCHCTNASAGVGRWTNISLLFVASRNGDLVTIGAEPAALMAADDINRDPSMLPGRRLSITTVSHEVNELYANSRMKYIHMHVRS